MIYKLPILDIILSAFIIPWRDKQYFLYTLALPTLIFASTWAAWNLGYSDNYWLGWIYYGFYFLSFSAFAITCHCLMLVQGSSKIPFFTLVFAKRVIKFTLWFMVIYLISWIINVVTLTITVNVVNGFRESQDIRLDTINNFVWLKIAISLPSIYVLSRMALILPSIAINEPKSIKWSWVTTKNNSIRMFLLVGIFPLALTNISDLLWYESIGAFGYAVIALITYLCLAIGIFVLSLAYRDFMQFEVSQKEIIH